MDGSHHPEVARNDGIYAFEQCQLDPIGRQLLRNGVPIKLTGRLFETLLYLVQNPGRLVGHDELMAGVWRDRTVDEANVRRAVSSLRQALAAAGVGSALIVTEPGRGYRFAACVAFTAMTSAPDPLPSGTGAPTVPSSAAALSTMHRSSAPMAPPRILLRILAAMPRRLAWWGAAVLLLAVVVARLWIWWPSAARDGMARGVTLPRHAVAVLPFTNASGDPAQDYLAEGVAAELINSLGRVDGMRVASRLASSALKTAPVRPADIGARLHVDRLLEGSIQRVGGHVHVTTQLVDARTLDQIWARRYDAPETDMLTVEGRIAEEVVMSLKGAVLDEDMSSLRLGGTTNPQAYDSDLSGLVAMNAVNTGADRQAIESFDRAIAADPGYAEAYAQRAQAATFLAVNGGAKDSAESTALLAAAAADAEHAVQLAPELAAAHVALGSVLRFQLSDLAHAAQAYQRAMELAPQDPYIIMHYALMQAELGHSAPALDAARRAVALDPLQPTNYRFLAEVLLDAGQYDDALTALHHARNLQPIDLDMDRIALALVQLAKGDMQGAEKTCGGAKDFYDFACLAVADHAVGNQVAALAALGKLSAMLGDQGAYNYAGIYAAWGQQDTAIHWLQRAYALRDPGLTHIKIESSLRPLHGTKAYQDIVRALKFPP